MWIVMRFLAGRRIRAMFADVADNVNSEPIPEFTVRDLMARQTV